MGVSGQCHVPAAFYSGEKTPGIHWTETGWAPETVWTEVRGKNLLPLPGIEPRAPYRPVRSQTLYWMNYLGCRPVRIVSRKPRCRSTVRLSGSRRGPTAMYILDDTNTNHVAEKDQKCSRIAWGLPSAPRWLVDVGHTLSTECCVKQLIHSVLT
jgi:hypothetical protein